MDSSSPFLTAAALTFGLQFAAFCVAAVLQTEVFYDIIGGLNFISLPFLLHNEGSTKKSQYFSVLFVASRSWLLIFLAWRAHSRGGDSRFDGVKDKPPVFFIFWMAQAFWVYLISMPLLVLHQQDSGDDTAISTMDLVLLASFAFGIVLEVSSDVQKTRWVSAGRKGGFCQVGWWKYSRHPNYAAEMLQWWCAAFLARDSYFLSYLSPLFTMNILLNMSGTGVWAAEGKGLKRYYESKYAEEYRRYREVTSPVIPMIGYGSIPLTVKRWFLFEWERFEYRPSSKTE